MAMNTTSRSSRAAGPAPVSRDWKAAVKSKGSGLPGRLILHGVEGVGKTSFAAHAPKPIFLMARGETGLETLIDAGRLSETPHMPEITDWAELLSAIEWLTTSDHDYKTLVIDTLNGLERMCHEFVCDREFKGNWSEHGFAGFQRGYDVALADWRLLLIALDRLRVEKRMGVIALCHTKVVTFKNPEGTDYDRYAPDMHHKTWSMTHKWADDVLFAMYYTEVVKGNEKDRKGKGQGGQLRVMYTTRHAAYDAKNRHGLPEEIEMGDGGQEAWTNFTNAIKEAKGGNVQ